MTRGQAVAAFVATRMATGDLSRSQAFTPFARQLGVDRSMKMDVSPLPVDLPLKDYSGDAINFFFSIRVPAALLAGSSLAAIFALKSFTTNESFIKESRINRTLLLFYHILGLLSFCLSIVVIVTTTAAGNSFLLRANEPLATSCNAFLVRECEFEFILVRFSFYTSLLSFLASVALRVIFEFNLLKKDRKRSCLLVALSVGSIFLHLVAFINERLLNHSNLFAMGATVLKMSIKSALQDRNICQVLSFVCGVGSFLVGACLILDPTVRETTSKSATNEEKKLD